MLIIGEKINGTRRLVNEAVLARDADFIGKLAREQAQAGADLLDVNAGTTPDREPDDLVWLIRIVQESVDIGLCLDSSNPLALAEALKVVVKEPMINSISGESDRLSTILPIAASRRCMIIALAMDESGLPKSVDDRLNATEKVFGATRSAGLPDEKVYVDPLIMTVATDTRAALVALLSMREIKGRYPRAHLTSGLSNVSFGLPGRPAINRTFLTLALEAGLDSAIVDPTNRDLRESLLITEMLLGRDPFCRKYTRAFKAGLIGR